MSNSKTDEVWVHHFDTAETYGSGLSEKIVGELVHDCPLKNDLFICTKWQPGKWARLVLQDAKELDWDGIDALDAAAAVRNDFRDKTAPPIEGAAEVEGRDGEGA